MNIYYVRCRGDERMKNPMQNVKRLQFALLKNHGIDFMLHTRQIYSKEMHKNITFYNIEYFNTETHEKVKIYGTPSPYRLMFKMLDIYKAIVEDKQTLQFVLETMAETEPTRTIEFKNKEGDTSRGYAKM